VLRSILADRVDATAYPRLQAAVAAVYRLIDVAGHTSGMPSRAGSPVEGQIR
jgi:hypothetical protein